LKILFVSAVYPHGAEYGAQQRVVNLCRQLSKIGKLSIALCCRDGVDRAAVERTRTEFDVAHVAEVQPQTLATFSDRLRFELDPTFLNTHFSAISARDRDALVALADRHDVVWVHTLRTANECGVFHWPHSVIDIDDVPSRLHATVAQNEPRFIRRSLDRRMTMIWRRREGLIAKRFSVATVCSDDDRRYLRDLPNVITVPNGFAVPSAIPDHRPSTPPRLGFIGLLRWAPNVDGIEWFVDEVWPLVKQGAPDARFRIVGGGSKRDYSKAGPDIDCLGYIDDPTAEIASWSAMIVPLRMGGGTRVKIAQAFGLCCPVVSTSMGAFGYDVTSGKEIMLADGVSEFAEACVGLIRNEALAAAMARNAREVFLARWTWDAIGPSVRAAVALAGRVGIAAGPPRIA
jgi:glycosyltransferase involved in cell wall biosynthesis